MRPLKPLPPLATLQALFDYSPETGLFTRISRPAARCKIGDIAGSTSSHGYVKIVVEGGIYSAHRLAWLIHYESEPPAQIDHINGNRSDNRIENLRSATNQENSQNRKARANACGYTGVSKHFRRYIAHIRDGKAIRHLGLFETPEEAHAAYCEAKAKLHSFHPAPPR